MADFGFETKKFSRVRSASKSGFALFSALSEINRQATSKLDSDFSVIAD